MGWYFGSESAHTRQAWRRNRVFRILWKEGDGYHYTGFYDTEFERHVRIIVHSGPHTADYLQGRVHEAARCGCH